MMFSRSSILISKSIMPIFANFVKPKLIVTLGPAARTEADLLKMKDKGVNFVRINMSHSSHEDLLYFIRLAKKAGIPFILDTDGSQVRTGSLAEGSVAFSEGDHARIYHHPVVGGKEQIAIRPKEAVEQLAPGDLLFVDFDTLVFRVSDVSTLQDGYVSARVMTAGALGKNKAVTVVSAVEKKLALPVLSDKDRASIDIGLREGIVHIAVSFVRRGDDIDEVKIATGNAMRIIAKIESRESLEHLDDIIAKADAILLDRGDLSKEIPVEKIPLVQKIVLRKAKEKGTPVFIATNLLESMVEKKKPTRAEVHDVLATIADGADGLILSAETAIGKYPFACINMMQKLIVHAQLAPTIDAGSYLSYMDAGALIPPHGGKLVERLLMAPPEDLSALKSIILTPEQEMDVEQIAIGTFSPLEGFMGQADVESVLERMRLVNGLVWPIPIVFDVAETDADDIAVGDRIALADGAGNTIAVMYVDEKYPLRREDMMKKSYLTDDPRHPGVRAVLQMKPILLAGKIDLVKRRASEYKEYELTPKQTRRLFEDRGWAKVVGFHTRNVIHRGHEFIQMQAMEGEHCDGLFVHPVVGKKKPGDFHSQYIIKSYEKMMQDFYPKNSVVFATFATFSRYAGPREALFTALCRKNFGCSHFIVGRDHTGVGNYYHPNASHRIFDKFSDIGITPILFDKVFYSKKLKSYVYARDVEMSDDADELHISGTEARKMMEDGTAPPEWFMRPEISAIIMDALKNNENVFVKGD